MKIKSDHTVLYSEETIKDALLSNNKSLTKTAKQLNISTRVLRAYIGNFPSLQDVLGDREEEILEGLESSLLDIVDNDENPASVRIQAITKLLTRYGKGLYTNQTNLKVIASEEKPTEPPATLDDLLNTNLIGS